MLHTQHLCQNCRRVITSNDLAHFWPDIPNLYERVSPGEPCPSGECPHCGALTQGIDLWHHNDKDHTKADWKDKVLAGDTLLGYADWLNHKLEDEHTDCTQEDIPHA